MGFGSSSLFAKIGFILIIVALVIQILGMAIPFWYELSYYHTGIFRGCAEIFSTTICAEIRNAPGNETFIRSIAKYYLIVS